VGASAGGLEALVETVRESLVVLDRELRVRTANRAFYETFGVSPPNTVGKFFFDLGGVWKASPPELRGLLEKSIAARESLRDYEFQVESAQFGRKTLVANARPIFLPGESDSRLLLALEDVTERNLALDALKSSEARYRRLFETAREAIWIQDAKTGEILEVNPFATGLFGYEPAELIGRRPWDLPIYEDRESATHRLADVLAAGHDYRADIAMRTKDGRSIRVEKIRSVLQIGGRTVIQSNMRDLTERRRLEDELRHVQRMESIGRLAGGIAHDFNNILNIISAYSSLLAKVADPARRAQSAEAIEKAVQRGAALVRQLLTFARRDGGKFETVDVNAIVGELAEMISETFPKSIAVSLDLEERLPRIPADPSQLHQALLNLSVNARDAMPDGGQLQFQTRIAAGEKLMERFPDAFENQYVCVAVADTGAGIDPETRSHIFEPFFTTKGKESGSGLGLSVVYGVANSHGGFVDVVSESGKGSTFSLYLPVRPLEENRDDLDRKELAAEDGHSETILVVEDEELLLDSMKSLIESAGYQVLTAKDGVEAVEIYERHSDEVAVVFADLVLPRLGGWEAFLEMKKINPQVRAILTSGTLEQSLRAEMRREGVSASIRKPYTAVEMLGVIRRVLRPQA
ncbi:MAG TPA: PAS domain S-box protein, partial [Thermoanaerobaculia bacterium]